MLNYLRNILTYFRMVNIPTVKVYVVENNINEHVKNVILLLNENIPTKFMDNINLPVKVVKLLLSGDIPTKATDIF